MKAIAIVTIALMLLVGCATSPAEKVLNMEDKDINQIEIRGNRFIKHSQFIIHYWKAILGEDIRKLGIEANELMEELLDLTDNPEGYVYNPAEKATILGKWQRLLQIIMVEGVKSVADRMIPILKQIGLL